MLTATDWAEEVKCWAMRVLLSWAKMLVILVLRLQIAD